MTALEHPQWCARDHDNEPSWHRSEPIVIPADGPLDWTTRASVVAYLGATFVEVTVEYVAAEPDDDTPPTELLFSVHQAEHLGTALINLTQRDGVRDAGH